MDWKMWTKNLPSNSPDLIPLDYFMWEYVKKCLYQESSWFETSKRYHHSYTVTVTLVLLCCTWTKPVYCLDVCDATNGFPHQYFLRHASKH